ncbi:associate of myc 1 domain-containing protein [Cystoisospora suis]|uniref:Associate of myc 1 domain-containing protein n=1 Tax=Cystoisospora suis TaxID=483139 RepID=A0A2C6JJP8_9APIC|nr:associate of myc 1 domain-containing protein [Cystoisospora suis]
MSTGTREEESPSDIQSDSGSGTTADAVPGPPPAPEANTAPPSLDEAKVRRRKQKMREFRKYLVDTRVIDALLTLLVALWEAEERPSEPQEFFIDYFGEYRDPVLDEIDELKKLQEELSVSNKELQEKQKELCTSQPPQIMTGPKVKRNPPQAIRKQKANSCSQTCIFCGRKHFSVIPSSILSRPDNT